MKGIVLILFAVYALVYGQAYTDVDDTFDINGLVNNKTQYKEFLYCYLDKGPCTTKFMIIGKSHAREATKEICAKCTDIEKHMYYVFIETMKKDFPEEVENYINKYADGRKNFEELELELKKYKDLNVV